MWKYFIFCTLISSLKIADGVDSRRPIWNIGHMVNAIYQVGPFLDLGANSLEFDVVFDGHGMATFTFHGYPCDCFRSCTHYEHFTTYIDYLRRITTPGDNLFRRELVLLMMDLKVNGLSLHGLRRAGEDIISRLLDYYWQRDASIVRPPIVFSIPSINHIELIRSMKWTLDSQNASQFHSQIGFDFSGNELLDDIHSGLEALGRAGHVWQGDGITNCLFRGTARLEEALRKRDDPEEAFMQKVYYWTVDKQSSMRNTLRMGIDAFITNHPDNLVTVLHEAEFSSQMRLANFQDSPWKSHSVLE